MPRLLLGTANLPPPTVSDDWMYPLRVHAGYVVSTNAQFQVYNDVTFGYAVVIYIYIYLYIDYAPLRQVGRYDKMISVLITEIYRTVATYIKSSKGQFYISD